MGQSSSVVACTSMSAPAIAVAVELSAHRGDGDIARCTATADAFNEAISHIRGRLTARDIWSPAGRAVGHRYGSDVPGADHRLVCNARPIHIAAVVDHDGGSDLILRLPGSGSPRGVPNRCSACFSMENKGGFPWQQLVN